MKKIILFLVSFGVFSMGAAHAKDACLNIDKASAKEIAEHLKGAGPAKAKAIISYRAAARTAATKEGRKTWNFNNWATLLKVKGLGAEFCTNNIKKVCFGDKTAPQKTCPKMKALVKDKARAVAKPKRGK